MANDSMLRQRINSALKANGLDNGQQVVHKLGLQPCVGICLEGVRDGCVCSRTDAAAVVFAAAAVVVARGVAVVVVSVAGAVALPAVVLLHWHFAGPGAGDLVPVFAVASGAAGSDCYRASVAVAGISGPTWDCQCWEERASGRAQFPWRV